MKILVFGLGALGHVFAAFLERAGHQVVGIGRPKVVKAVQQQGINVSGIWGEFNQQITGVYEDVSQVKDFQPEVILLTVKSYDTAQAVLAIKPLMNKNSLLICAQNGYGNYEVASKILGTGQVALARVIFGAELKAPGQVKVTVCAGDVVIGDPTNQVPLERLQEIAKYFSLAGIPASASSQIEPYIWDKILYNCALNALGALLEVPYGTLGDIQETRSLMNDIIDEVFEVARANGVSLFWQDASDYIEHFYQKLLPPTREHHASMLQDIKRGKKTEIDALNGAMVRLGQAKGVSTPVNQVITQLIKAKEQICKKGREN